MQDDNRKGLRALHAGAMLTETLLLPRPGLILFNCVQRRTIENASDQLEMGMHLRNSDTCSGISNMSQ